jgi:hypothetical protein
MVYKEKYLKYKKKYIDLKNQSIIMGGKPVTKSQLEKALTAAQNCIDQLTAMMSNIEKNVSISESQVTNAKLSTHAILSELNMMEEIIKKEKVLSVSQPVYTGVSQKSSSYTSQEQEQEDWWKYGPSDVSPNIGSAYDSQWV